jgi:hypothetical protein
MVTFSAKGDHRTESLKRAFYDRCVSRTDVLYSGENHSAAERGAFNKQ